MNRINFLGCPLDCITMEESIAIIEKSIEENRNLKHVVVNTPKLMKMQDDPELAKSIRASDLINIDGQGVVWGARFLGYDVPERVAGIDVMSNLVELAHRKKYKIYFLGAREEIVKKVVDIYSKQYSPDIIAGYRNGYFKAEDEKEIAENIARSGAKILFVAIPSPKKEIFLEKYKDLINIPFVMGVGGSFDVVSGLTKRAPVWMQKSGLEGIYRFIQEPKRMWRRQAIDKPRFLWHLMKAYLGGETAKK